jgi:hypothetical protein
MLVMTAKGKAAGGDKVKAGGGANLKPARTSAPGKTGAR